MPVNTPFFPPITPYIMPAEPFEQMIAQYGERFTWMKSHTCPCVMDSTNPGKNPGSPDPACLTCQGRGIYWDQPLQPPFFGLLTFMHMAPTPDEPGNLMSEKFGTIEHGDPTLTIPFTADVNNTIWNQASLFDAYCQIDALGRFNATLQVGSSVNAVPYQKGVVIAPSGAVTVYDPVNKVVVTASSYTVSGAAVTLNGYPKGTFFTVEFDASPIFIAFRKAGGFPHARPFGGGIVNTARRFRLQPLDIWTRSRVSFPNSASPQSLGGP